MQIGIVTLFPELFGAFLQLGFVGKAQRMGVVRVDIENLRDHGTGVHRSVDDTPYGGGSGMVMRVDIVVSAIERLAQRLQAPLQRVLLTPQGKPFDQVKARELSQRDNFMLICGRYEGFDERVREHVDEEVSLGDFVMTGGEVAALAVMEACIRLIPGVLGNEVSTQEESFSDSLDGLLEYPQYTRPRTFRGQEIPDVLCSGDHAKVALWRRQQAEVRTAQRRPELLAKVGRKGSG